MRALVDLLERTGLGRGAQAVALGYTGARGTHVMDRIICDESNRISRSRAFTLLCQKCNVTEEERDQIRQHVTEDGASEGSTSRSSKLPRKMRTFFAELHSRGVSRRVQAGALGFFEENGENVMEAVLKNKSTLMPRKTAFAMLREKLAPQLEEDSTFTDPGEAKMKLLVDYLVSRGVSRAEQSRSLGYSGDHGLRDMTTVAEGWSKVPRVDAFVLLRKEYAVREAELTRYRTERKPTPPPPPVDEARMRLLIDFLRPRANLAELTRWLGYSGDHPIRDMDNVIAGASNRISLKDAFKRLYDHFYVTEEELQAHRAKEQW